MPPRMTPMEIASKEFTKNLRGYSPREVRNFLEIISGMYAEIVSDMNRLKEEVSRRDAELAQHREREQNLRETILMAQKVAEDLRKGAAREAELTRAEAALKADELVKGAHQRMGELQRQIQDLKRQRIQAEQELRGVLETHFKMLEADREAAKKADETESKLAYMGAADRTKK
ncbi:MAG: DivIVA domain-containing protein [Bdellovibrionota bacterium]